MKKNIYNFYKNIYANVDKNIINKAKNIKILISDVDGVMSNGSIYIQNNGEEIKSFNVKDNYGIKSLLKSSIQVALISGRKSNAVKHHCQNLGISYFYLGQINKLIALKKIKKNLSVSYKEIAYIGDDFIDLPILNKVGFSIITPDSHPILLNYKFDYVTKIKGGYGALREICDLILFSQKKFDFISNYFI